VQDGVERPLSYASRQLNISEGKYTASEIEMLALVWATNYYRCYLFGTKFVVRTDHSALRYLRNFSDQNARLLRWSLKLAELDFIVEHRPGKKIAHADALSRHVGTVTRESSLDKETVLQERLRDMFCKKQTPGSYSSRSEFLLDDEKVMYRRRRNGNHRLVVPEALIQDVIRKNHDVLYCAHPGIQRSYNLIALNYWWPGMRKSIVIYVRNCDPCQRRKSPRKQIVPLGEVDTPKRPFEITSMDITGPYPITPRKNKYLLSVMDTFTRYVEVYPISEQTAEVCARIYATEIVI
jgi:hypothetical protein